MQISGVKEESRMLRLPAKRAIVAKTVSTKVLISMLIGATPTAIASWRRGYSVGRSVSEFFKS